MQKRTTRFCAATLFAALLCVNAGCFDLDSQSEIEYLRILAVQLEPAEILYSPFLALPAVARPPLAPPVTEVRASILAVDPTSDAAVTFTTHFCPTSDNDVCRNYQVPDSFTDERDQEQLKQALAPLVARRDVSLSPLDAFGTRAGTLTTFHFQERAVEYVLPHDASGAASVIFPTWARVLVSARSQDIYEVAYRRIPMNVNFDFSMLPPEVAQEMTRQFSESLGLEICSGERVNEEAPDCLKPGLVNQNPVIEEVRYSLDGQRPEYDDAGHDLRNVGVLASGPIDVEPGQSIYIWPVFADDSDEPYQALELDANTFLVELGNYREDFAVSWYATYGNPDVAVSDITLNRGYFTSYTYPKEEPPDRVQLYMVVRDQRGGVSWRTVELREKKR